MRPAELRVLALRLVAAARLGVITISQLRTGQPSPLCSGFWGTHPALPASKALGPDVSEPLPIPQAPRESGLRGCCLSPLCTAQAHPAPAALLTRPVCSPSSVPGLLSTHGGRHYQLSGSARPFLPLGLICGGGRGGGWPNGTLWDKAPSRGLNSSVATPGEGVILLLMLLCYTWQVALDMPPGSLKPIVPTSRVTVRVPQCRAAEGRSRELCLAESWHGGLGEGAPTAAAITCVTIWGRGGVGRGHEVPKEPSGVEVGRCCLDLAKPQTPRRARSWH